MTTDYQSYQKGEVSDGCRGYIVTAIVVVASVAVFLGGVVKWITVYW